MPQISHGFPTDPEMGGLIAALDPDAMATRFSEHVFGGQTVDACRIVRFRYRRGERLIVASELETASAPWG